MNHIFTDLLDNMKCISLTDKAWDFLSTALLVGAILYWVICSDYGIFFQLTGFVAFIVTVMVWIKKNSFAQKFINGEFDE